MKLTEAQDRLLERVASDVGIYSGYIYGAEVGVARRLQTLGLVVLTDDGIGYTRRSDGERWSLKITDAGRAYLNARQGGG